MNPNPINSLSEDHVFGQSYISVGTYSQPLVTFALFAFNQEQYIREAVEGALSQSYTPMEIILSDDSSSDRTFEIMKKMAKSYNGPNKVKVRKNKINLGLAAHVSVVAHESIGEIFILAGGDDISLPDRTTVSVNLLKSNPNSTAVLLSADVIDHKGSTVVDLSRKNLKKGDYVQNIDSLLGWKHVTFGATRAIRREVFIRFGPLNNDCPTEDTPLLLRSLMCGSNIISDRKVILYRKHEKNISSFQSLKKLSISSIYDQYFDDINKAEKSGWISYDLAARLRDWMFCDLRLRLLRQNMLTPAFLGYRELISLAKNPMIKLRTKIKFLLTYLSFFANKYFL